MDALPGTIKPNEEAAIRAAIGRWVEEGRVSLPASERLKRIRESLAGKNARPSPAPCRDEGSFAVDRAASKRSWLAVAAVILLTTGVLITLGWVAAGRFTGEGGSRRNRAHQPGTEDDKAKGVRPVMPPVVALVRGGTEPIGLYHRQANDDKGWVRWNGNQGLRGGELVQTAMDVGCADLAVLDKHRIKLSSGTLITLEAEGARVVLWRGRLEVWAEGSPLDLAALGETPGSESHIHTLKPGEHAVMKCSGDESCTIERDGFKLWDETGVAGVPCDFSLQPKEEPPLLLEAGAGNLLRVVECNFANQPLRDVVEELGERLELRVRLSAAAEAKHGDDLVNLEKRRVTGAEAITQLAQVSGLLVKVKDGDLVLTLRVEPEVEPVEKFDF